MVVAIYIKTAVKHKLVIDNQIQKCKQKAIQIYKKDDLNFMVYIEQCKMGDIYRKELHRLMRDVNKGIIQVIVCNNLSRITQNTLDLFYLIRKLYQKRVRLICADGSLDMADEVFRKYQLNLLSILAEMEYVNINERKKMALQ